jgi:hypothetical protein
VIRYLQSRKAPGHDGIQNIVLKHLPLVALKCIATIHNTRITLNYFLTKWEVAKIIMLPKQGMDFSTLLNYRPISLLDSLAELFEKSLLKRFNFKI